MSISEASNGALSLDALLGVQPTVEEPPAAPEPTPTASFDLLSALAPAPASDPAPVPSASLDLLSALGLVPVEPETKEPTPAEPIPAAPAAPALDLTSLLGVAPEPESEPTAELPSEPTSDPKPEPAPVRSRFADLPPFRSPEERPDPSTPKASEPPQKEPAKEQSPKADTPTPASQNAASPAVKYLAGESRPLALSAQCTEQTSTPVGTLSEPEKPVTPAQAPAPAAAAKPMPASSPEPVAKPIAPKKQRPSVPAPEPTPASAPATATKSASPANAPTPASAPATKPTSQSADAPTPTPTPAPASAPASQLANAPAPKPVSAPIPPAQAPKPTVRPQRSTSSEKPTKRSGVWYLLGVCLFAIALACACFALYSSVASYAAPPLVSNEADAPTQAASRTFRYSVQGSDGAVRTVTEQIQLNVDGIVAETTISFNAESEAEATWFLNDAKSQFADAWVSGSVQGNKAVFTLLPARDNLNAETYEALLKSNTTDCTVVS